MTKKIKKTKVEIYFILYLAALILLLPDSKKDEEGISDKNNIILTLIPEKTVLNLRLLKTDQRNSIIKFDSTNKIYFDGEYDNIDFTYTISDVNRGETVEINELNNSKELFQITEDFQNKFILFRWNPDFNFDYNSTFLVKLQAIIEKNGESKTASTQFTLNTLFLNQVTNGNNTADNTLDSEQFDPSFFNTAISIPTNLSEMDVKIMKNPIVTFADNEWINYITIYNIESIDDLYGPPKITIQGDSLIGGAARFESSEGNYFVFSGMSPTYDTMKVMIKVKRKADDSELSFDFLVIPTPRTAPDIPNVMYVGETYQINSKLDGNKGLDSYTIIKAGNIEKKYTNNIISFTPDIAMLDANVILTRYVENKKLDNYTLVLKRKPKPQVENIELKNNRIIIKTKSFSLHGNQNYIDKVNNNANLKFIDLIGKSYYDDDYLFQTFESERLKTPINSIEIQLIDKNGQKSIKKTQSVK